MSIRPTRPLEIEDVQGRLDRLREAANESARSFRTAYTFYLIVALYILVIVSSTHHEFLFRAGDVQMPIVNVGVPVVWFFTVVPWLLVILHFNLLVQAIFLANKVSQYAAALEGQIRSRTKRSEALGLLFPAPLAHKVADAAQRGSMKRILNVIVFVTLAVLPPAILILAQVQFLPYQGELFTWLHRAAVIVDIGLLWWLWPRIAVPHMKWCEWYRTRRLKASFVPKVTAFAIVFSTFFADFPGGTMGNLTPSLDSGRDLLGRKYDLSNRVLVHKEPSPEILAAHYRVRCESRKGCDESVIAVGSPFWCKHAKPLQLEKRHFRNAALFRSTLCQADLGRAKLHGAHLWGAELHGAHLRGAELHRAHLSKAKLHGAHLRGAELHEADLLLAELHGADLWGAELHGAHLSEAELHGADLWGAELHGAHLSEAELHGAHLRGAELHGADLWGAELHGANLLLAELHGAHLSGAELHGANLRGAEPHGADLSGAELHGADLWGAEFYGTNLRGAKLHRANLRGAKLHHTDLREVDLSSVLGEGKLEEVRRVIKKINDPVLREQALKRIERIESGKTSIEFQSLKYSILCEGEELYTRLKGSKLLDENETFVINCQRENEDQLSTYYEKLGAYLVDLVRSDESGYVAKGIAQRSIPPEACGLPSWEKLSSIVVRKGGSRLYESDCKTGEASADEAEE